MNTDIKTFYEKNIVPHDFDCEVYKKQFNNLESFYQPYCIDNNIDENHRLYYHYYFYSKQDTISIILACKNRTEHLDIVIENWINQPYVKEMVIVDFSSSNPVKPLIQEYLDEYPQIRLIRVDNEQYFNLGKAYNLAFEYSTCDFIMKIDADYLCKTNSFIDKFMSLRDKERILIRGHYGIMKSTSGFFLTHRSNYCYFREDLNGWGYDDFDLYNRISVKDNNKEIFSCILLNLSFFIHHISHPENERSINYKNKNTQITNAINKNLCKHFYAQSKVARNNYFYNSFKNIEYEKIKPIPTNVFCINHKNEWKNFETKTYIKKFKTISPSKKTIRVNDKDSFYKNFKRIESDSSAINSLTHYSLWKLIVSQKIDHALILEDTVDIKSLSYLESSNLMFKDYELINLSKKISCPTTDKTLIKFDGSESYILSLSGAKKLLEATYDSQLLNGAIAVIGDENIPVSRFIGCCCSSYVPEKIRLDYLCYPVIEKVLD